MQYKQFSKHFEEAFAANFDKKDDDSIFDKELKEFMQETKKEMTSGDDKITSCMLASA